MTNGDLVVENGSALVCYAFDVGVGIDLVRADQHLAAHKKQPVTSEKKRQAKYFEFTPPPLRLTEDVPENKIGARFVTLPRAELLIFDFGSVSVRFTIPLQGPVREIVELSAELYENQRMQEAAKRAVTELLEKIRPAVDRPALAARIEDYCIFHFAKLNPSLTPNDLLQRHIVPLTGLLRAETLPPSDREVQEILSDRISYGSNDVTLMSWYAAVIYGEDSEDIYRVLEFTNLVLMELSFLDSLLDRSLDEFYDVFTGQQKKRPWPLRNSRRWDMRRIAQLQIDSAILFERITNALKLMGDDFQARVYQLATKKMGLSSWDTSITRKLQTIESIYQKTSDTDASKRMEVLEIIVIILIAVSILWH